MLWAGRVRSAPASAGRPRTKLPLPCWVSIHPSCRSADSALTIVGRDTPKSLTSWCSDGSSDPGGYWPRSMRLLISATTCAYFGGA